MRRLKFFFAFILLALALPFWRFADIVAIVSPFELPLTFALTLWFAIFLAIPAKLIFPKIKTLWLVISIFTFGGFTYGVGPLSNMASRDYHHKHCSSVTYAGFFYPIRGILSDAHKDDLEARNQLCWVRKMISKVPEKFDNEQEVNDYTYLIQQRLLKPEIKYRASLPLIALLYGRINTAWGEPMAVKRIYDSLHFWITQYTEEISEREYPAWNWPHSDYIKWEYGLVEKNWQSLIDSIVIQGP